MQSDRKLAVLPVQNGKTEHTLTGVSLGTCVAISSALVYSLEKGEDGLKMTLEEASWIRQLKMYNILWILVS